MGMERMLSIGGRLQRLIKEAEVEAERRIEEAKDRAKEMISQARTDAEDRRARAQRGRGIDDLLQAEEGRAKKDAEVVLEGYKRRAEEAKEAQEDIYEKAVDLVLMEVLPR